jgi:hypothetical protein
VHAVSKISQPRTYRQLSGKDIPLIAAAYRKGLGEIDLEKLTVLKLEC